MAFTDNAVDGSGHRAGRRWRGGLIGLVLFGVLVVVAIGAWAIVNLGGGRKPMRPAAAVAVAPAVLGDMPDTVTALGTVQPLVTATVRTQIAGVLFALSFKEGELVHQGQVLAQIDPRPYQIALRQAQATLARDTAQLDQAKLDLARYQTLLKQESIAAQQVDSQRATVAQLAGTVAADKAAIDSAALNLGYTAVKAPITGRIGIRQADIGNYLTPSDTAGIAVVTQLDPIDVQFALPQAELSAIGQSSGAGAGLPVAVRDQSGQQLIATGQFLTFDNQIDATTGTVKAKARFTNGSGRLYPGGFVNVSMLVRTLHQVVVVPASAVRHGSQGDFVFRYDGAGHVHLQVVHCGPSADNRVAVLDGVKPGDSLVIEGADGLEDGAAVRLPGEGPEGLARAGGHQRKAGSGN